MFEPLLASGTRRPDLRSGWISTAAALHGIALIGLAAASVFAHVDAGSDPPAPFPPFEPGRRVPVTAIDVRLGDPDAGPHHGRSKDLKLERPEPPEKKPDPPKVETQPQDAGTTTVPSPDAPPPSSTENPSRIGDALDGGDGPYGDGTGEGDPGPVGERLGRLGGKNPTGPPGGPTVEALQDPSLYGVEPPVLLVRVEPTYPELERGGRVEGKVLLEALVGSTGRVESVRVLASPRPGLTAAAVQAVERWRYKPARQNGRAIGVTVRIEVRFELR